MTLKVDQGHRQWAMAQFNRPHWPSMSLYRFWDSQRRIMACPWIIGKECHHSVDHIPLPMILSVRHCKYSYLIELLEKLKNIVTLKSGLGGHTRSLEMAPFDRLQTSSYLRYTVPILYHFRNIKCRLMACPWNSSFESFKVIDNSAIW